MVSFIVLVFTAANLLTLGVARTPNLLTLGVARTSFTLCRISLRGIFWYSGLEDILVGHGPVKPNLSQVDSLTALLC